MATDNKIRTALKQVIEALEEKPELGLDTAVTHARLEHGFQCVVRQGVNTLVSDMGAAVGGDGTAPSPGFYGRAAIVACVAMGIKLTSVRLDVAIDAVEVDIEQDFDDCGLFAIGDVTAGCLQSRLAIRVQSSAPEESVRAMVDEALKHDPLLINFREAQKVSTSVTIQSHADSEA